MNTTSTSIDKLWNELYIMIFSQEEMDKKFNSNIQDIASRLDSPEATSYIKNYLQNNSIPNSDKIAKWLNKLHNDVNRITNHPPVPFNIIKDSLTRLPSVAIKREIKTDKGKSRQKVSNIIPHISTPKLVQEEVVKIDSVPQDRGKYKNLIKIQTVKKKTINQESVYTMSSKNVRINSSKSVSSSPGPRLGDENISKEKKSVTGRRIRQVDNKKQILLPLTKKQSTRASVVPQGRGIVKKEKEIIYEELEIKNRKKMPLTRGSKTYPWLETKNDNKKKISIGANVSKIRNNSPKVRSTSTTPSKPKKSVAKKDVSSTFTKKHISIPLTRTQSKKTIVSAPKPFKGEKTIQNRTSNRTIKVKKHVTDLSGVGKRDTKKKLNISLTDKQIKRKN